MKGIPKRRGLLVVAFIAAMVVTSGLPVIGTSYAADPPTVSSGAVSLSKEAVNAGINEWDVAVTVNGSQQGRSSDIVIVMDRSRSMSYTDGTRKARIEKAKGAAKDFVSQVLVAGSHTRIAVVTFDKTATIVQDLTSSALTLNQKIGTINANYKSKPKSAGGTNIQAGLHKASELIAGSTADLKSVVLIGDGEPTHSFVFTGSVEAELVSCTTTGEGIHIPEWKVSNTENEYDYDGQIVGYGNSYYITGPAFTAEGNCPNDPDNVKHTYIYPANHGIPSVYEADRLGDRGVRIYSVGIGVNANGEAVLEDCAQNGGYLYINKSDSAYDFSGIADAIGSEAFQSVVTDPIGELFEPASDVTVSTATPAVYDPATRTITWNIGKLNPGQSATMTYRVRAKAGAVFEGGESNNYPDSGEYPTNGETTISYQYTSGNPFSSAFEVPKVPLTGGAVILKAVAVNSAGHLISSAGAEVEDFNSAQLLDQGRFPEGGNQYMVYGSCQVSMGAITGYEYRGWQYGETSGGSSEKAADIELTTEKQMPTVYFKYYKEQGRPDTYPVTVRYVDESGKVIFTRLIPDQPPGNITVTAPAMILENTYTLNDVAEKTWIVIKPTTEPPIDNIVIFKYKVYTAPTEDDRGGGGGGGGGSEKASTPAAIIPPALNKTDHFAYVVGYPDGEVKPLGTITREEVAVIFYRLMTEEGRKQYYSISQPFTDVNLGRWSNDEIATLYNAKIIQGNTDGSFEPSKPITRAEFAAIAAKFDKLEEVTDNKFPDIEKHWAKKYINSSAQKGWISGYGDGTFRPDNIIIRCEAMKMINEELDRRVNTAGLCIGTKQWPDNTVDKWYYEIVLEATNTHDYESRENPKSTEKWTKIKDNPVW